MKGPRTLEVRMGGSIDSGSDSCTSQDAIVLVYETFVGGSAGSESRLAYERRSVYDMCRTIRT